MKRKILFVTLFLVVAIALVLPIIPARAQVATSEEIPSITEKLSPGWERISPTTTVRTVAPAVNGMATVEYRVSAVEETLGDNTTLIDNRWYYQVDPSGQWWFENGNNQFKARVTSDSVTVLDKKGRISVHSSALTLESNTYKDGKPKIVDDPLNGQYKSCLMWEYGKYGKGSTLTRYLRSNNGRLSELWVLSGKPSKDLIFRPNITQAEGYGADTTPMFVFDANYNIIGITANLSHGFYIVEAVNLQNVTYPVYIDPTYNFTPTEDTRLQKSGTVYNTVRTATSADFVLDGDYPSWVGQEYWSANYWINRSTLAFNTSSIPATTTITQAHAWVYGYTDGSDTDFSLYFCSGQPTYPHTPVTVTDFNRAYYTVDSGAGYNTAFGWSASYHVITLNNTGWIIKGGTTKLILMSSRDIAGTVPTGEERVAFWQAEHGAAYTPWLYVVGTAPVTAPIIVTSAATSVTSSGARLNGYISSDGGATCSVQFQYGLYTSYGFTTAWASGYSTGSTFSTIIAGLAPGTTYHFRAVATNTAGTGYGSDATIVTAPLAPTFFTAIGGSTQVSLSWVKGTGAYYTLVLRKTGSYPTSTNDGTVVYYNNGSNCVDSPLTNGVTYYYGAWSYATDLNTYSLTSVQSSATPTAVSAPGTTTGSAFDIGATSATLQGILTSLGGYASADVWFDYGETLAYELGSTAPQTLTATGTFSAGISGLNSTTLHHFRAVADGAGGTSYGTDITFTTGGVGAPAITTNVATGVQITSAQLNGTVTSDGGSPPVTVWFDYGLTTAYELGSTPTAAGLVTSDTFYYGLGGLTTNSTYHYRAVGQNTLGTTYGIDQSFITTTATAPTTNTNSATSVGAVQVTLQGTLLTDGGATCDLSFEWGLTTGYGNTVTASPSTGSAGTAYSALVTGLVVDTTYHFRANATNNGGTGNGTDMAFTTVFGPPTDFMAVAVSSSTINLSWVLQGDQTFVSYKTTGYPVNLLDGTEVYFGLNTYATLSGLTVGTTYYFSAWSWKTGGVWTSTNANAIATTYASTGTNDLPQPTVPAGEEPTPGGSWFDVPTSAVVRNLPLYDIAIGWSDAFEVPEGTFLAILSLFLSMIAGAVLFVKYTQAIPAVCASIMVIVVAALIQACPPVFAIFVGTLEIGAGFGLMSLGGNIAGKGA
jgi:hypothetical protein